MIDNLLYFKEFFLVQNDWFFNLDFLINYWLYFLKEWFLYVFFFYSDDLMNNRNLDILFNLFFDFSNFSHWHLSNHLYFFDRGFVNRFLNNNFLNSWYGLSISYLNNLFDISRHLYHTIFNLDNWNYFFNNFFNYLNFRDYLIFNLFHDLINRFFHNNFHFLLDFNDFGYFLDNFLNSIPIDWNFFNNFCSLFYWHNFLLLYDNFLILWNGYSLFSDDFLDFNNLNRVLNNSLNILYFWDFSYNLNNFLYDLWNLYNSLNDFLNFNNFFHFNCFYSWNLNWNIFYIFNDINFLNFDRNFYLWFDWN